MGSMNKEEMRTAAIQEAQRLDKDKIKNQHHFWRRIDDDKICLAQDEEFCQMVEEELRKKWGEKVERDERYIRFVE